jgi:hypothetical protein
MEQCWSEVPPLFQVDPDRVASCFLHEQAPVLPPDGIGSIFRRAAPTGHTPIASPVEDEPTPVAPAG